MINLWILKVVVLILIALKLGSMVEKIFFRIIVQMVKDFGVI